MGSIVITGNSGFQHTFAVNPDTGMTSVTIKNEAGTTTLGTVEIETVKARAFFNALAQTAREYFSEIDLSNQGYKTTLDKLQKEGITRFG
jgi:hypothetical protein